MISTETKIVEAHGILEDILMYLETMDTGNIRDKIEEAMKILDQI